MKKYFWLLPALYVSFMFGGKITEGMGHSEEFQNIISIIPFLKPYAYTLTPLVGVLDFCIALLLLGIPLFSKNKKLVTGIFIWTILWPFVPSSLRYFGGVADFEIVEVLSISLSALLSFFLYKKLYANTQIIS